MQILTKYCICTSKLRQCHWVTNAVGVPVQIQYKIKKCKYTKVLYFYFKAEAVPLGHQRCQSAALKHQSGFSLFSSSHILLQCCPLADMFKTQMLKHQLGFRLISFPLYFVLILLQLLRRLQSLYTLIIWSHNTDTSFKGSSTNFSNVIKYLYLTIWHNFWNFHILNWAQSHLVRIQEFASSHFPF